MGLLGDFLPKDSSISGIGDSITTAGKNITDFVASGTADFSIASMAKKVGEGAEKLLGNFGKISDFKNIANGLPTGEITAKLIQQGIGIGPGQTLTGGENMKVVRDNNDDVVVKLVSTVTGEAVIFSASPRIGESRQAQYSEVNITHHPGAILKYDKTGSRTWSVSGKFVSRTREEATMNQYYLNTIRSWLMPYYGTGTEIYNPEMLGAPPPILEFSGYGANNISTIPVVLEGYNTSWPNDVDYLPTYDGDPFPVILEIDINLKESYSPAEYSAFDLYSYKTGNLSSAYGGKVQFKASGASTANAKVETSEFPVLGKGAPSINVPSANDIINKATGQAKNLVGSTVNDIAKSVTDAATKAVTTWRA